jgi:5'-methylthioadenosine phosphorylase
LKEAGANAIVAIATVGGISAELKAGDLVVPHQIIDYTWGRESTYYDGFDSDITHVDFTQPYSPSVRSAILMAARESGVQVLEQGVYAATQGPRLETAAEIDRLERDGADIVGMTGMPEAVLARERSIPYGALAVVVNPAAGRGDSIEAISLDTLHEVLERVMNKVNGILARLVLHDS